MAHDIAAVHQSHLIDRRRTRLIKFGAGAALVIFGFWTIDVLDIPIERLLRMFGPLGHMLAERMLPPDMVYATSWKILASVVETVEMSLLGAFFGTIAAIPLAWMAAWNVTPSRSIAYPLARGTIVLCRSLPTLMIGLLLVAILGFGPFAGVLALVVGTIGFAGKLMSEQVEAIEMGPVEAIRATGAGRIKTFVYGIFPQVKPAWTGVIVYNWDARLRSSTILGYVGAGGIGLHLRAQISVLEYQAAMGIIAIIIVLVILSETLSHFLRDRFR